MENLNRISAERKIAKEYVSYFLRGQTLFDWTIKKKSAITFVGFPMYTIEPYRKPENDPNLSVALRNREAAIAKTQQTQSIGQDMTQNRNVFIMRRCNGTFIRDYVTKAAKSEGTKGIAFQTILYDAKGFGIENWEQLMLEILFVAIWYLCTQKKLDKDTIFFPPDKDLPLLMNNLTKTWKNMFCVAKVPVYHNFIYRMIGELIIEDKPNMSIFITDMAWPDFAYSEILNFWGNSILAHHIAAAKMEGADFSDPALTAWTTLMEEMRMDFNVFEPQSMFIDDRLAVTNNSLGTVSAFLNQEGEPGYVRLYTSMDDRRLHMVDIVSTAGIEAQLRWCYHKTVIQKTVKDSYELVPYDTHIFRTYNYNVAIGGSHLNGDINRRVWSTISNLPLQPGFEDDDDSVPPQNKEKKLRELYFLQRTDPNGYLPKSE